MSDQGTQYSAYIEAQLQAELARRESVNSRSTTAITSSAGLVTLALAVFAVMIGKDFVLGGWAKGFLAAALLALLGSASFAVAAGFPWKIKLTSPATLRQMIGSHWKDSEVTARGISAYTNVLVLESLRPGTNLKLRLLLASGVCQILAVALLGSCTLAVVFGSPRTGTASSTSSSTPPSPSPSTPPNMPAIIIQNLPSNNGHMDVTTQVSIPPTYWRPGPGQQGKT